MGKKPPEDLRWADDITGLLSY